MDRTTLFLLGKGMAVKNVIKQRALSYIKIFAMVLLLIYCIQSGYFWLYFIGLMGLGIYKTKDACISLINTYYYAIISAWNKPNERINVEVYDINPTLRCLLKARNKLRN